MTNIDVRDGFRSGVVAAISCAPFGVLFGALAIDNSLSIFEVALMSATIYAGASQIVGIELFGQNIPGWIVVLSVFAVNFRHILYSAAITPAISHYTALQKAIAFFMLIDPQFAEASKRNDQGKPISFVWYMSMAITIYVSWLAVSLIGAYFGRMIGDTHALGFDVLPAIYFLGMLTGFRHRQNFYPVVFASGVTAVIAYHLIGSPWHVSIGAAAGILVAAILAPVEKRQSAEAAGSEV